MTQNQDSVHDSFWLWLTTTELTFLIIICEKFCAIFLHDLFIFIRDFHSCWRHYIINYANWDPIWYFNCIVWCFIMQLMFVKLKLQYGIICWGETNKHNKPLTLSKNTRSIPSFPTFKQLHFLPLSDLFISPWDYFM